MSQPFSPSKKAAHFILAAACLAVLNPLSSSAHQPQETTITWGVYDVLGGNQTQAIYQPLAEYLDESLPGFAVRLKVLPMDALTRAALAGQLDLVSTNPTHFIELRAIIPGSAPVATLLNKGPDGTPLSVLGGCIFVRADDLRFRNLPDLKGARIATPGRLHMGGFLSQAYELHKIGIHLPQNAQLLETGSHPATLLALLEKRADAAFVRSGILESMLRNGQLHPGALRIIHPQNHPGFEWLCSTPLYPEWPVIAMPNASPDAIRPAIAAFLTLTADHPAAKAAGICGFTIPADYQTVDELARTLRLPPYQIPSDFNLADIWKKYRLLILTIVAAFLTISLLIILWLASLRHQLAIQASLRTKLENANSRLQAAASQARNAAQIKADFLATMSHEIRTPLNGLLGMLHLAANEPGLPGKTSEHLQLALASGERLLTLLNNILDLSKIEAGRMTIEAVPFDLHQLLKEQLETHAATRRSSEVTTQLTIAPATPRYVLGDAPRIGQILGNLLGNAFKFTTQGSVTLSARPAPSKTSHLLHIEIKDTGPGIPAEDLPRIFTRFEQSTGTASKKTSGTGLGLAISKQLIELMGGQIGVESAPGKGTLFWFELPLPPAAPTPPSPIARTAPSPQTIAQPHQSPETPHPPHPLSPHPNSATPLSTPTPSSAHRPLILVVEDNPTNQLVASGLLKKLGCDSIIASSGEEALALAHNRDFDLILMDVQMPGMDGLETTRRLHQEIAPGRLPPIVAMTAHALPGDRQRCMDWGMSDYLTKPVNPRELAAKLKQWAGLPDTGSPQ